MLDDDGEMSGDDMAYIYLDFETALRDVRVAKLSQFVTLVKLDKNTHYV
jgi:hypothetical protein